MLAPVDTLEGDEFPTIDYPVKHVTWERDRLRSIAAIGEDTDAILSEVGFEGNRAAAKGEE